MMPDYPLEPAKATGRVRRLARKAAVGLLQISLGAACLIGTYWGVTRFLAGDFEPAFANVQPTFRGASATGSASGVLASTTQVRATEMPEIIGGVPELMPVKVSASTRTDQPKPAPTVIRNFPEKSISSAGMKVEGLAALDPISGTQPAASYGESSSDQLRSHEERVASGPPAQNSASVVTVPEVPTGAPAITSGSSEPSVTSPLPQVASTALNSDSAKEIVSRVHREDAESAKVSAALPGQRADREAEETAKVTAPTIMPPNRTDAQEKGGAIKDKRVVQRSQAQAAKRTDQSAVKASSSAREATTRSNAAPKRNDKPATAQRTRVAAAPSEPSTPPTPPPAAAESVAEQRVHLLGIPLPTGRKVRECLLEWRC